MEVLDKILALVKEMIPLLLAMGIPVGSIWGVVSSRRRKEAAAAQATTVLEGTPVPASSSQAFQDRTLDYFIAHSAELERDLEKAHDALRKNGIPIP